MTEPVKQCTKCGETKPATPDFFAKAKRGKYGFAARCKACDKIYYAANAERIKQKTRQYYSENKEYAAAYGHMYREQNGEKKKQNDRRRYQENRLRIREKAAEYRNNNRESLAEQNRIYREKNKEKLKEKGRKYYLAKREDFSARNKAYRSANPGKIARMKKEYYERNKSKIFVAMSHSTRRKRARKLSLPDTLTVTQWQRCLEYWGYRCAYCGREANLLVVLSLDHFIPLSSPDCPGTTVLNSLPACHKDGGCNSSKNNRPAAEWLESKFGKRKAKEILAKIAIYFDWVRSQPD